MGLLERLEQQIGGFVEGLSARLFRGRLSARAVAAAIEAAVTRTTDEQGHEVATNDLVVRLNDLDLDRLAPHLELIRRDGEARIRQVAAARGWKLAGRPRVTLENTPQLPSGQIEIQPDLRRGPGEAELVGVAGTAARCLLVEKPATIGRDPGCDLVIETEGVSRQHARVEPRGDHYVVTDLGSTNGTTVNGARVAMQALRHGNVVGLGPAKLEYRER
ncbi:MAG: DUF3662 domain-containing protein [Armatimonadetes bacterium]|nr:DUF3662 domain-containing protein [Armatimonadota bacterium]